MRRVDELVKMSQVDIRSIDKSCLVDVESIEVDPEQPVEKRIPDFLSKISNPYCFKCGNTAVKIKFAEDGKNLDDSLKNFFLREK